MIPLSQSDNPPELQILPIDVFAIYENIADNLEELKPDGLSKKWNLTFLNKIFQKTELFSDFKSEPFVVLLGNTRSTQMHPASSQISTWAK